MKKLFSLFLIGFSIILLAQDLKKDSIGVAYVFKSTSDLKKSISNHSSYCYFSDSESLYLDDTKILLVTDIGVCNDKYYVKGYFFGKEYYIEDKKENFKFFIPKESEKIYDFEEIQRSFNELDLIQKVKLNNFSKYISLILLEGKIDTSFDYIKSFDKYSVGIIEAHATSNYSMTGAKFKIYNSSKKTIKYITFNFYGKNAVEDKVQYRKGVYNVSRKGIGPVESYATASWEFDDVWLTDIVEYLSLTSLNIIYMDGTSKVIKVTDNLWIDEDKMNSFVKLSEFRDTIE